MENHYGYVYKVTNKLNGKIYVGARARQELDLNYYGSGKKIKAIVEELGKNYFNLEVLKWCNTKEELIQEETYWIDKLDSTNPSIGYNIKCIGLSGRTLADLTLAQKQEYYKKQSKSQSDRTWIYRGNITKRVKNKDLDEYLQDGWIRGRIRDINSSRKAINKDGKTRYIEFKDLKNYLDKGWKLGQDKDLTKKWSQAFKGKHHSEETRKKIGESNSRHQSGEGNSNYGRKWMYNEELKTSKSVSKENVDILLKEGWQLGRKIKFD